MQTYFFHYNSKEYVKIVMKSKEKLFREDLVLNLSTEKLRTEIYVLTEVMIKKRKCKSKIDRVYQH